MDLSQDTHRDNEILSLPLIMKWAGILTIFFVFGIVLKSLYPFLFIMVLIWFFLTDRIDYALYALIFWIFFSNFYSGQGFYSENMAAIILKVAYLLFIGFFLYKGRYNKNILSYNLRAGFFIIFLFFVLVLLVSLFLNDFPILRILTTLYFIFIFFFLTEFRLRDEFYKNVFNIIPAIGLVQVPIAVMQFKGIIAPAQRALTDTIWTANLDDAASGTFGAAMSPDLSWFLSFMTLFFFSYGIIRRSWFITIGSFVFFIQYMVVDSKAALIATIFMFCVFFLGLLNNQRRFNIKLRYLFSVILIFATFGGVFFFAWKSYYKTLNDQTNIRSFETVGNMYMDSYEFITNSFFQWGKISGFYHVTQMQFEENPVKFFVGFGPGEFNYKNSNSRGFRIRAKLPSAIRRNNGLNERSGMITIFAQIGILGLILTLSFYFFLNSFYKKMNPLTDIGKNMKVVIGPFLIASLLYFAIYINDINRLAINAFWIINATVIGLEQNANLRIRENLNSICNKDEKENRLDS